MEFRSNLLMRPAWQRYLVAITLTLLVVVGRWALNPWWGVQQNRHLLLLPTVMLATWLGGFRPGVASALLSTLALQLLFSKTPGLLHRPTMDELVFLGFSLVICGVVSSLQLARARADTATRSRERVLEIVAQRPPQPADGDQGARREHRAREPGYQAAAGEDRSRGRAHGPPDRPAG